MKTSVIEVREMLSVFSVDEVEKRIAEVPGVESATVNYAAASATVRYDETRLEVADIKSTVRRRGYDSAVPTAEPGQDEHRGHSPAGAAPPPPAAGGPKPLPVAPAREAPGVPPFAPAGVGAGSPNVAKEAEPAPDATPSTAEGEKEMPR